MSDKQNKTLLEQVLEIINYANRAKQSYENRSLIDITRLTKVEPLTIISNDCRRIEYTQDILQTLLSLFTAYYLRAVAYTTVVSDVKVAKVLDRLNPDRNADALLLTAESIDDFNYKLPGTMSSFIMEAIDEWTKGESSVVSPATDKDTKSDIIESSNLAIGKLINVKIQVGDKEKKTVEIPVEVRLAINFAPNQTIKKILNKNSELNNFEERLWKWKAGEISFIKDLIFCQDLINEHKHSLMTDTNGLLSEVTRRANNAKKYGALTANPSLVSASNLIVITTDILKDIESNIGGKLSNARVRQSIFENSYAMIIAVVDQVHETVIFYSNGIATPTEVSVKSLKGMNKNKGPDIMDMLKAYSMSTNPTF